MPAPLIHHEFEELPSRELAAIASEPFFRPDLYAVIFPDSAQPGTSNVDVVPFEDGMLPRGNDDLLIGAQVSYTGGTVGSIHTKDVVVDPMDNEKYVKAYLGFYGDEVAVDSDVRGLFELMRLLGDVMGRMKKVRNLATFLVYETEAEETYTALLLPKILTIDIADGLGQGVSAYIKESTGSSAPDVLMRSPLGRELHTMLSAGFGDEIRRAFAGSVAGAFLRSPRETAKALNVRLPRAIPPATRQFSSAADRAAMRKQAHHDRRLGQRTGGSIETTAEEQIQ